MKTEYSNSESIIDILKEVGKIDGDIPPESDIYTDLGVEQVNSISIDDNEFIQARTLTKLVDIIRKK